MEIGGVTALGLPASLSLCADSKVMQCDYIILGGGSRSIKIKISPSVFKLTPNTEVIEGLASNRMSVPGCAETGSVPILLSLFRSSCVESESVI